MENGKKLLAGKTYLVWTIANRADYIIINQGSQYQIIHVNDMGFWFQDLQAAKEDHDKSKIEEYLTLPCGARIAVVKESFYDGDEPIGYREMLEACDRDYRRGMTPQAA